MSDHSWIHIYALQSINKKSRVYDTIVIRDRNTLYYFANSIAWSMGHAVPHKAVENLVSEDKKYTFDWISGIFLRADGVHQLVANSNRTFNPSFLQDFFRYQSKCKIDRNYPCPP